LNKNIWYISKYFAPSTKESFGGRGWFLVKEFKKLGNNVTVISSDSNNLVELPVFTTPVTILEQEGIKLVWLKTTKYTVAKSIKRILSWFHFEMNLFRLDKRLFDNPDVIVVSSLSLLTVLNGIYLKRKYGCRVVFEVRDIWPLTITEEGGFSKSNIFVRFLGYIEKLGYLKLDAIVGTMPNLEEHVINVLGEKKIVNCIPMGISQEQLNSFAEVSVTYVHKYLSSNKFKIVHAGTIGITNALDTFFEAATKMGNAKGVEFIIVGDGPLKQHYIEKYGHLKNVIFAPRVYKTEVLSVLKQCDLVYFSVHKSEVWKYGQSLNKVIDYMLSGKPILASYTGYPSMVNEANCGTFVPAGDVDKLVSEINRYSNIPLIQRNEIGSRGIQWLLSHRDYKVLAKEYMSILYPDEYEF
jgi:glycosyltransferase involved in cell wall biosynthesis